MQLQRIIFLEVEKIINSSDPIGLIEGGAPDDEYHTEIGQIVNFLHTETDTNALARKIQNLFEEKFEEFSLNEKKYLRISDQLIELKKRLRW